MRNFWSYLCLPMLIIVLNALTGCQPEMSREVKLAINAIDRPLDFNFDVRPILADRCFSCHGPDEQTRKGDLRLDTKDGAFSRLKNAKGHAFVGGNLQASMAWKRIITDESDLIMPPKESNLTLTDQEKAIIAKWIEQGAEWKEHWAFIPPAQVEIPESIPSEWTRNNAIDYFIQAKLLEQKMSPGPEADRQRLIRRLTFDLTGLPPTISEIEAFVNDDRPDAYEDLVDSLLNSIACAERLAMEWLDVARYADSHGMHADGLRIMWPWRDWVIEAFNKNLPYDQFVTWQLAGDLIPHATQEQKLATGFLRNQPLNSESGIVPEEFRLKYVADRTNTTATAFLGLTMECATCHDHKFDPISQKEYYQMSAFFNSIKELGMIGNDMNFGPLLLLTDTNTDHHIKLLTDSISMLEAKKASHSIDIQEVKKYIKEINTPLPLLSCGLDSYQKENRKVAGVIGKGTVTVNGEPEIVAGKFGAAVRLTNDYDQININGLEHFNLDDPFSFDAWIKTEKTGTFQSIVGNIGDKNSGWRGWLFFMDTLNRPGLHLVNNLSQNYIHVVGQDAVPVNQWLHIAFTYDGSAQASGVRIYINGQSIELGILSDRLYKNILPVKFRNYQPDPQRGVRMGRGTKYLFSETDDGVFYGAMDQVNLYDLCLAEAEVMKLSGEQMAVNLLSDELLEDYYSKRYDPFTQSTDVLLRSLRKQKYAIIDTIREVMVLEEMPTPRKTHILRRGQYDDPGEEVSPHTPTSIFPYDSALQANRLGLAQWLFQDNHPLTSRVAVNRYWQMIFGRGIVSTPHDFGVQGALPTHPQLLDWLAMNFRDSGWNVKKLLKLMVMSATYKQSSVMGDTLRDTKNLWLSRGPNYRMPMEMIRDNALASSGLLVKEIGGESVKPYQPDGLWKEKNEFSGFLITYQHDAGEKLYRRSMYTFIRRTSPPPIMTIFDAPTRDVCTVKREVTNTPLQALVLLNDPQFMEAARVLAERIQYEGGPTSREQIKYAFRLVCGRMPEEKEAALLMEQFAAESKKFQRTPQSAKSILDIGERKRDTDLEEVNTAALAMVCNTILNFDEAYMKR
ncbi:MAG: DUF1553 domain-containing protein [Saprospiraceae bacterium]|nr:DUF1553 domain-containing protein [Saprospiraceae bacterium]